MIEKLPHPAPAERVAFLAWRRFLEVHACVTRRLDAALQSRAGIALGWYDVLVHVDEAPSRRIRLRELEQSVLVSQSTVSRLAVRMERAGLLTRTTPADDRRSVEVRLTSAGTRLLRRARGVAIQEIRGGFAQGLTSDDAQELLRMLSGIRACQERLDGDQAHETGREGGKLDEGGQTAGNES